MPSEPAIHTRADLASLPAYVPGRSIPGAIKLASNEVPGGPPPGVAEAIARAATDANRYPDMGAWALVDQLANRHHVAADRIAVGCGSVSVCQQLIQALCDPGDEVLFAWRSFEAYPIVTQVAGARPVTVPLDADYRHDLAALRAAITPKTRLVFVCNPNNPSGTAVTRAELTEFLADVPPNVLVVLDEAYREFVTDDAVPDGIDLIADHDNVAVLRTFSKAYGLAGLRVGYVVAPTDVTTAVRKVYVPFSVNAVAQAAASAALDAVDAVAARCAPVIAERGRVRDELRAAGYPVPETQANFVWLPLGERSAEFAEHALEHKIVVRPFNDPDNGGVRITIGTHEENDQFLTAARSFSLH